MKKILLILLLSLIAYPSLAADIKTLEDQKFHAAQTEPERALDKILQANALMAKRHEPPNMHNFLVNRKGYDQSKDIGYAHFFTKSLIDSAAKKKAASCQSIKDQACTFDYNVVSCLDGDAGIVLKNIYHTEHQNNKEAVISYVWPRHHLSKPIATYKLVYDKKEWKIDGIDCGEDKFNMP